VKRNRATLARNNPRKERKGRVAKESLRADFFLDIIFQSLYTFNNCNNTPLHAP